MLIEYMYSYMKINVDVYVTILEKLNTFKYPYLVIFIFTKYKTKDFNDICCFIKIFQMFTLFHLVIYTLSRGQNKFGFTVTLKMQIRRSQNTTGSREILLTSQFCHIPKHLFLKQLTFTTVVNIPAEQQMQQEHQPVLFKSSCNVSH